MFCFEIEGFEDTSWSDRAFKCVQGGARKRQRYSNSGMHESGCMIYDSRWERRGSFSRNLPLIVLCIFLHRGTWPRTPFVFRKFKKGTCKLFKRICLCLEVVADNIILLNTALHPKSLLTGREHPLFFKNLKRAPVNFLKGSVSA